MMVKYERPEDLQNEKLVAAAFAKFIGYSTWDKYKPDEVYAVPDYLFYNQGKLELGAEIKRRNIDFGQFSEGYMISAEKLVALRCYKKADTCIIVACDDRLANLFPEETAPYKYSDQGERGRRDRHGKNDLGIQAFFRWSDLKVLFDRGGKY